MSDIRITVSVYGHQVNQERLALADRYIERARNAIDRRDRQAFEQEADRIYREEYP